MATGAGADGRSHYRVLGVREGAGRETIRVAYLNLARALHPDRLVDAPPAERRLAERRMREVNEAYEVLGDPTRRAAYDRERAAPPRATTSGSSASRPSRADPHLDPDELDDLDDWSGGERWEDDDVELTPLVAFLLRRGPMLVVLTVAALLFVVTAYAGGGRRDLDADPTAPATSAAPAAPDASGDGRTTTVPCNTTPITGVTGGSVVVEPC